VPQGNGIRRSKDLRAKVKKFLILTNERKKMSKTTIRKRISLTVVAALSAGLLTSVATAPAVNAHKGIVSSDTAVAQNAATVAEVTAKVPSGFYVAETLSNSGAAVAANFSTVGAAPVSSARSLGLLAKDASSGVAQTATMLTSGTLSLYWLITTSAGTAVALTATGGTFGVGSTSSIGITPTMNQTRQTALFAAAATGVGQLWTAPSTAGTYTIAAYYHGAGAEPTLSTPAGTLFGQITVTVVAASAGGSYNAANSFCAISNSAASFTQANNSDSTAATVNGRSMYINFALNDAYGADLDEGNIVVTATGGANVAYADGSVVVAGTSGTAVAYDEGAGDSIRVTQGTADAPTSSTVTISYNGVVVCTKTVGFAGAPAKVAVTVLQTQDLGGSGGKSDFLKDGYARSGLFTVLLTDAAGNQVQAAAGDAAAGSIPATGTFSSNSASLAGQTIVTELSVDNPATQTSTTLPGRLSTGIYTCGSTAGEVKTAKLDFTIASTGKVITSDAFTLRCADDPYSYTASFDKASYVQGDLAILTVSFLDSKGNPANSVVSTGGWTGNMPMLTNVTATGAAASLGTTGTAKYTYTVGTPSGMTAGTYTSIVDFTTLTAAKTAVVSTPTYKLSTGGDTTSNADILKSIVALIASINKQIQALQKLILKR
jgi:prepilin-type processing-associated H-X9-DG protein